MVKIIDYSFYIVLENRQLKFLPCDIEAMQVKINVDSLLFCTTQVVRYMCQYLAYIHF